MSNQGELAAVVLQVDGMEAVDGYTVIGEVVAVEAAASTLSELRVLHGRRHPWTTAYGQAAPRSSAKEVLLEKGGRSL